VDLNKEIKLGDLFRRKAKESKEKAPEEPKPPKEPRRGLFARKEKPPKEPKAPRAPKEKTVRQAPKAAPPPPAIPLMRAFNLLPREESGETRTRLGLAQVLVALLGLLVVAGLGTGYLFMSGRATEKQAKADDLRVQIANVDVPSEAPDEAPDPALATESQARTTALAGALTGRVAWDRVLREVTLVVPDDVWLTSVTAQTPGAAAAGAAPTAPADPAAGAGNAITIVGTAESQEAVAGFLARLGVVPELVSVQLQTSTAEVQEGAANVFTFTVVATVDPAGAQA
jgi:Tfp pilus assembly protein PilN